MIKKLLFVKCTHTHTHTHTHIYIYIYIYIYIRFAIKTLKWHPAISYVLSAATPLLDFCQQNQTFWTALDSWVINLSFEQFPLFISGPGHLPPLPDICPFVTCPPDISPLPYSKSGHLPPVRSFWIICKFFLRNVFLTSVHEFKIYITLIAINVLCARSAK